MVVATEVRSLAERCAKAAQQIRDLIASSGAKVDQGVALVMETGDLLGRVTAQVTAIRTAVAAVAAASSEQASSLAVVNEAVREIDRDTQKNAAMAEETSAATASQVLVCDELGEIVGRFRFSRRSRQPAGRAA
jgi:methyl-accepting chemotaxis protein